MMIFIIALILFAAYAALSVYQRLNPSYNITFVAGEIGSGKSTYSARYSERYRKAGYKVYSNRYIKGCYPLAISNLQHYIPQPKSCIIIDESGLEINSRDFKQTEKSLIAFFKLCRHYRCNVLFLSQTFTDTDKQIRDLSTRVLFIRKVLPGLCSMAVSVKAKLGVGQDGQPCMQYKIGHIGGLINLVRYRKLFRSFDGTEHKAYLPERPTWDNLDKTEVIDCEEPTSDKRAFQ